MFMKTWSMGPLEVTRTLGSPLTRMVATTSAVVEPCTAAMHRCDAIPLRPRFLCLCSLVKHPFKQQRAHACPEGADGKEVKISKPAG